MTEKHKKLLSIFSLVFFAVFMVVVFWFAGRPMIELVEDPDQYRAWIDGKGIWAQISFIAMVFFQVIFAIIPGEPLEICAGIAFGGMEGTLLCLLGIFLGSAVIFLLVRKLGVRLVEVFFSVDKIRSLHFLQNEKRLDRVLFFIMMIPGTPKDLLSYFVPLTKISLGHWLALTTFARIPSVVTSTVGGDALGEKNYLFAAIVFAVTCLISLAGAVLFDYFTKKRKMK